MNTETIIDRIRAALIAYDIRASRRPGWNPYALALYFNAMDGVRDNLQTGLPVRAAILDRFTGRVATAVLKAVGERAITPEEARR